MENKKDFLQKLTQLFLKYGAKTYTMDDIAKQFSISKKTLYKQYTNKEQILCEVLDFALLEIKMHIEDAKEKYENPIEAIINTQENMEIFMTDTHNIFILQMAKYYPEILNEHKKKIYSNLINIFSTNIKRGRTLGLYREDFNENIYFKFLLQLFFSVEDSPFFEEERKNNGILCIGILDFYLNSILTEKGLQNYKALKDKYGEMA